MEGSTAPTSNECDERESLGGWTESGESVMDRSVCETVEESDAEARAGELSDLHSPEATFGKYAPTPIHCR